MLCTLTMLLRSAIEHAFPALRGSIDPEVARTTDERFGDYQSNVAMQLARSLGRPPREIALAIQEQLPPSPWIETVDVAGPGFLNIRLAREGIADSLNHMALDPALGVALPPKQRVVLDFSSPNIAKEMHVGHLRSTIIGESLARLLEFLGHDVRRLNHIGDWGTAFGMLIAFLQADPARMATLENASSTDLLQWYQAAKQRFDHEEGFRLAAQQSVVALQGGDPVARRLWAQVCALSRRDYAEIYNLLDVRLQERGESSYQEQLPHVVAELEQCGLTEVSEGALCIFLPGFVGREGKPLPMMIRKSDGGYNYDTTDLAALKQRIQEERADRIIVVTDAGQSLHFAMLEAVGQAAGWFAERPVRFEHVVFGLVLGADGKKLRTRSGKVARLQDLLDEAVEQATAMVAERHPDWEQKEITEVGKTLGINAVKYADLSCHRTKDYQYSLERMLRFDGNTAPFLLYSLVRARSILRRLGLVAHDLLRQDQVPIQIQHPSERALALHLLRFQEVILAVAEELLPHRLADYLYELAERFNHFFRDCKVEGDPAQGSRARLVALMEATLAQGLHLLGLQLVDRM